MKRIIIAVIAVFFAFSCKNVGKVETEEDVEEVVQAVEVKESDSEIAERLFKEFQTLYNELLTFKDKPGFKDFGFGQGGPYHSWISRARELEANPNSRLLISKGIVVGELTSLGLAYVGSEGKETNHTEFINRTFAAAINPPEKVEAESGDDYYQKLKKEYELFGSWRIENSFMRYGYDYEIYRKQGEYIGVKLTKSYSTEVLEKKGNRYYVKGNRSGEYYVIDANKNMTLFDRDGELASAGWTASKK